MTNQEKCNCQYEEGHSFECPLYEEAPFIPQGVEFKEAGEFSHSIVEYDIKSKKLTIDLSNLPQGEEKEHTFIRALRDSNPDKYHLCHTFLPDCQCDRCFSTPPAVSEAHKTKEGWCCACDYDITQLEAEIEKAREVEHCTEPECPECKIAAYNKGKADFCSSLEEKILALKKGNHHDHEEDIWNNGHDTALDTVINIIRKKG